MKNQHLFTSFFFILLLIILIFSILPLASKAQDLNNDSIISESEIKIEQDTKRGSLMHAVLLRGKKLFTELHIEIVKTFSEEDLEIANKISNVRKLMKYIIDHPNAKKLQQEKQDKIRASQQVNNLRQISEEESALIKAQDNAMILKIVENNEDFSRLRSEYKINKEYSESCKFNFGKCKIAKQSLLFYSKDLVSNRLEAGINYLSLLKIRLAGDLNMVEAEVALRTIDLDGKIAKLEELKIELGTVDSIEGAGLVLSKIRAQWSNSRNKISQHNLRILHTNSRTFLEKSEKIIPRLECGLTKIQEKGNNSLLAGVMVTDYKIRISQARTAYNNAEEAFSLYEDVQMAEDYMRALSENLLYSYEVLYDFSKEISNSGVDIGDCRVSGFVSTLDAATRARVEAVLRLRM